MPEQTTQPPVRILCLGKEESGKSALCQRLADRLAAFEFDVTYKATMGVEFYPVQFGPREHTIPVQLRDAAGAERFKSVVIANARDMSAFFYCFDSQKGIDQKHLKDTLLLLRPHSPHAQHIFFIATKVEVEGEKYIPSEEKLQGLFDEALGTSCGLKAHLFQTDVKTSKGILELKEKMYEVAKTIAPPEQQPVLIASKPINEPQPEPQPTNACFTLGVLSSIAAVGSVAAVVALVILAVPLPFIMIPVATTIACGAAAGLFFFASRNASKDALEEAPNPQVWGSDL